MPTKVAQVALHLVHTKSHCPDTTTHLRSGMTQLVVVDRIDVFNSRQWNNPIPALAIMVANRIFDIRFGSQNSIFTASLRSDPGFPLSLQHRAILCLLSHSYTSPW